MTNVTVGVSRTRPETGADPQIRENEALYLDLKKLTKWDENVKPYPGVDPDKAPVNPAKEK